MGGQPQCTAVGAYFTRELLKVPPKERGRGQAAACQSLVAPEVYDNDSHLKYTHPLNGAPFSERV